MIFKNFFLILFKFETSRVNCVFIWIIYIGTTPIIAPELLLSTNTKLSLEDLMIADIWSLGMTLFVLLNPDILYLYQIEADQSQSYDLASFKKLITEKFTSEMMPKMSLNYEKKRMLHWLQILQTFDM